VQARETTQISLQSLTVSFFIDLFPPQGSSGVGQG
jgi:hypothetical protein